MDTAPDTTSTLDTAKAADADPTMSLSNSDNSDNDYPPHNSSERDSNNASRKPLCAPWTAVTQWFHNLIKTAVVKGALHAAKNPICYVVGLSTLSLLLLVVGFLTNFELELDLEAILSPTGTQPAYNRDWVNSAEGFPNTTREVALLLHRHGDNVLRMEAMERVFDSVKVIRETDGYEELCQQGDYVNFEGDSTCRFLSATGYFEDHLLESFQEQIHSDEELRLALSPQEFENGSPVYHDAILGNWEKDDNGTLTFAQSYLMIFFLPDVDDADEFEETMFDRLDELRRQWVEEDTQSGKNPLEMDMMSFYGTQMEYQRAIQGDLYLVPVVALIMGSFVALTFFSYGFGHEQAKSRTLLGFSAVFTITMSYLAGNGLMFCVGVPFSPITQILPFVVYGIGMDDSYIIAGAYCRTDPRIDSVERIRITMEEVAHSISLTTITTVFAFLLGLGSSLPGVQWLCMYAWSTIAIDFVYQVTLFCAFIVLDERRIQNGKRDICFWLPEKGAKDSSDDSPEETVETEADVAKQDGSIQSTEDLDGNSNGISGDDSRRRMTIPERIMSKYADFLLQPHIKGLVLLLFAALLGCCIYSTSLLEQEFKVGDFVPEDSYIKDVAYSAQNYASAVRRVGVYFRNIDQTDPEMQAQMRDYVNELESLSEISSIEVNVTGSDMAGISGASQVKPFCWVRDFHEMLAGNSSHLPSLSFLQDLTFTQQLDLALANPTVRELYAQDIIRDETGNITASRCWLFLTEIDLNAVEEQTDLLHAQREIGAAQPVNQGKPKNNWSFFFYDQIFFYWEAYDVAVKELISTIVLGVIAVTVIAFLLVPHWSAVFFVTPMMVMLYVNFLGTLQFFGLHINGIFYFCVLVSIGLLVDFLLHILMRYYETSPDKSRDERVKETLETMGASIILGGLTTFLGVAPLCFSSTRIFMIVFLSFLAMVTLGIVHGLVLLPVVLSLVGPTTGLVSLANDGPRDSDSDKEEASHQRISIR